MTVLRPAPVSTEQFSMCSEGMLVSEASSLRPFGQVYDDACDEGLTLVSHVTGREVVYGVQRVEYDREGDLLYWDLEPVEPTDRGFPTARVFND